jgi:Rrf2 family protein
MFSNLIHNAVHALLLVCKYQANGPVTTEFISKRLGLSISYLESLMSQLKKNGFVISYRGPGGGYQIRGNPEDISLWDVVQHFEELHSFDALYPDGDHPMKALESDIQSNMQALLKAQTLSDVAVPFMPTDVRLSSMLGQFRLKPLPAPIMPRAPNSVFQLSMMM